MIEQFIQDIAKKAGHTTLKYFNNTKIAYTKRDSLDVVTHADLASNKILTDLIRKQYPNDGILSEESGAYNLDAESMWIIDPLDGTLNFSKGIPTYCVLVGHAVKGTVDLGAIYDPVHDELYFGAKNKGAYLNNKKINTSKTPGINLSVGSVNGLGKKSTIKIIQKIINQAPQESSHITSIFCIGLCCAQLAAGKRDWFISTGAGGDWDYAAGKIILEESGCSVTDIEGKPWQLGDRTMVTANPVLHKKLIEAIK